MEWENVRIYTYKELEEIPARAPQCPVQTMPPFQARDGLELPSLLGACQRGMQGHQRFLPSCPLSYPLLSRHPLKAPVSSCQIQLHLHPGCALGGTAAQLRGRGILSFLLNPP